MNDNFGRWRSDFRAIVRRCTRKAALGAKFVSLLTPEAEDYFVLKPENSGFYSTVLDTMLRHLEVDTLVLAGLATDNCVLYTAHDAYLRGFRLFVPTDCSAAQTIADHRRALKLLGASAKADTGSSLQLTRKLNRD